MIAERAREVFVLDDHPIVLEGLEALLAEAEDFHLIGRAVDSVTALSEIPRLKPDLVITDLTPDSRVGLGLLRAIRATIPDLPILVFSSRTEAYYAEVVIQAGAQGFLSKRANSAGILNALRRVAEGKLYVSDELQQRIINRMTERGPGRSAQSSLTRREQQVLEAIGRGLRTREVAAELRLNVKTVEAHRSRIKEKLGLSDYMELLMFAFYSVHLQEE